MKKLYLRQHLLAAAAIFAVAFSPLHAQSRLDRLYILNEGNFDAGNATVTAVPVSAGVPGVPVQDAYAQANGGLPLGDVLQSAEIVGDELWLVVNNSHRITRVNPNTLQRLGTINIPDNGSPRYLAQPGNGKVYVTLLYGNAVAVIDQATHAITKTIPVGGNPEGIVVAGGRLFVANSGFGNGNTVSVIDPSTDAVTATVTVADYPTSVVVDGNGTVWVLCTGAYNDFMDPDDDTPGTLVAINPETLEVEASIVVGGHPSRLALLQRNRKLLFIGDEGIASLDYEHRTLDGTLFAPGFFYGLGVSDDADESVVFAADAKNFIQAGSVEWFSRSGQKLHSLTAGIIPGSFAFVGNLATSLDEDPVVPSAFGLDPAYPNPFNPTANVPFRLQHAAHVRMDVLDATGRVVRRLVDGPFSAGQHKARFDGAGLPSGVYLIRMVSGANSDTRKVTLIK